MTQPRTDKQLLYKGIKIMALTGLMMFLGPTLLYIGIANKTSNLSVPTIIVGGLICLAAIVMAFYGLKTIMDSMFNRR
jgi:hypothetical protein